MIPWSPGTVVLYVVFVVYVGDDAKVRLVDGSVATEGRVEINQGHEWGTLCDNGFDDREARVICRMLGYNG